MRLSEFKQRIREQFGPNLEHATPANVREFLDQMQLAQFKAPSGGRFVLDEPAITYEEIVKDFFSRVLDAPLEDAVILLWTIALELSFAAIEFQYSEVFESLLSGSSE